MRQSVSASACTLGVMLRRQTPVVDVALKPNFRNRLCANSPPNSDEWSWTSHRSQRCRDQK